MQNYSTLQENEQEESSVLFHVAEPSKTKYTHIKDLDSFFSRMYKYHQKHGFLCMVMQEVLSLNQYVFMVLFTTFLFQCVEYPILFRLKKPAQPSESGKVYFSDFILGPEQCSANFGFWTYSILFMSSQVFLCKLLNGFCNLYQYYDIKQFYNTALGIKDAELDNLTWNQVQTKVRGLQLEQQMCIHKRELTDLDIYHRILRRQNYLVAMTNKRLLPPRFDVPGIGEVVYWTKGLRFNLQFVLFRGPWSPFENSWHLREEYKKQSERDRLACVLGRRILILALANLLFAPLVLLWQILYMFFNYAELIKREPGSLGMRNWSLYGKLFLRHFNELDHEMEVRLSRAHRPAIKYLSSFNSPIVAIVARSIAFVCGAMLAVIIVLTLYDEDVLNVEHMLLTASVLTGIIAACRAVLPLTTITYCPEMLLTNVLAHTHYLPHNWKGQAHTARIRSEFQQLFQYRAVAILEELLSPVITPYVLWRNVYPRSLDLVDFYRNFTVSVVGVGDVCSFAQMDVRKHGNPDWQQETPAGGDDKELPTQFTQAEDGKTELSLLHFTLTNPAWVPPREAKEFVENVERERSVMSQHSASFSAQNLPRLDAPVDCSASITNACISEGPLSADPQDMSLSSMCLHDRYHKQVNRRAGAFTQSRVSAAGEATPLLSTITSQ